MDPNEACCEVSHLSMHRAQIGTWTITVWIAGHSPPPADPGRLPMRGA